MTLTGTLLDVYDISGRGPVVLLDADEGSCLIGDRLHIGEATWTIGGIEMVTYNTEGMRRLADGWKPPLGVLLRNANKPELLALVGQKFTTSSGNDR